MPGTPPSADPPSPRAAPPPPAEAGPEPDHGLGREARPRRRSAAYTLAISARQAHVRVDTAYVRKVTRTVLAAERIAAAQISVALADDATVRRVNRDFLGHDYDTDVLSFLFEILARDAEPAAEEAGRERSWRASRRGPLHRRRSARQRGDGGPEMAARFGWSAREELTLYLVHGLLHLCGYDDLSPTERRLMRQRERAILGPAENRRAATLGPRPATGNGREGPCSVRQKREPVVTWVQAAAVVVLVIIALIGSFACEALAQLFSQPA